MNAETPYPKTGFYREHKDELSKTNARSFTYFLENFNHEVERMFGDVPIKDLTREEREDVENFVQFAISRLSASEISSEKFHKRLKHEPHVSLALQNLSSTFQPGHDAMHALVAYIRSNRKTFVPAYTHQTEDSFDFNVAENSPTLLEESCVTLFRFASSMRKQLEDALINAKHASRTLKNHQVPFFTRQEILRLRKKDPKEFYVRMWEIIGAFTRPTQYTFRHTNRIPEIVNFLGNLYDDTISETPDPKFSLHEFQRMAQPLLERLRKQRLRERETTTP